MNNKIQWPDGKDFAFTVFDDTDCATLENIGDAYEFLTDYGFHTTKSVWPLRGDRQPVCEGATCEDKKYLDWIFSLRNRGFEVGYHMATYHTSTRRETIAGMEKFAELFGHYPKTMANHVGCLENIYWGSYRMSGINKHIYNLLTRYRHNQISYGHLEHDERFWGDICKEKVQYVRNFVFKDINTLKFCPFMPYRDIERPYVNYWFASSEGANVTSFNECISEENQDRLEEEGGASIMYTHFAFGFHENGRLNSRFQHLMKRLSRKNGWFVPVSTLLDYLRENRENHTITDKERKHLERRWLRNKLSVGTS